MKKTLSLALAMTLALFVAPALHAAKNTDGTAANYFKKALRFEPNKGQSAPQIDFVSHGRNFMLHLSPTEALLALADERMTMKLVGANPDAEASTIQPLETTVNYYFGNDPAKWQTGIPTYGKTQYRSVYPGIDIIYYGNGEQLEYDFVVAPGADPQQIGLSFPEARRMRVDRHGDLLVTGQHGTLQFRKPVVYQEVNGRRRPVAGKYAVSGNRVGFELARYDETRALVIDPTLSFSLYLGGSGTDQIAALAADSSSNVYVTGFTNSLNFLTLNPPPNGATVYQAVLTGLTAAFVTKLDATGAILFSTYFGGLDIGHGTQGKALTIDNAVPPNIYIAGRTDSDLLPRKNAIQSSRLGSASHANAFVAQFDGTGFLLNSTYIGGNGVHTTNSLSCNAGDEAHGIAVEPVSHNIYITGSTDSSDLAGSTPDCVSGFVLGLRFNGSVLFAHLIGDLSKNTGNGIAIDTIPTLCLPFSPSTTVPSLNVYVTGRVAPNGSGNDVVIAKYTPLGVQCYETIVGGSLLDTGNGIAVDRSGNAYVVGTTASNDFPVTPNALQSAFGLGNEDALILKAGPDGSVVYASFLGGSSSDQGVGIALDTQDNVSVAGSTLSANFPTQNPFPGPYSGGWDVFVARFDSTFVSKFYATYVGGSVNDYAIGLAVAPIGASQNNTFIAGFTNSTDFPKTKNPQNANASNTGFLALLADTNPTKLGFASQPQTGQITVHIPSFTVAVQDQAGSTVTGAGNSITIDFTSNLTGAMISGVTTVSAVDGVATFSGLSIDKPGNYNFRASASTLLPAVSNSFTERGPDKVVFKIQPTGSQTNVPMATFTVEVQDSNGDRFTPGINPVTIALTIPDGATINGASTVTVNAFNGTATFSNLIIDKAGSYTFQASSPGLTSGTSSFTVLAPTRLGFKTQPTNSAVNVAIPDFTVAVQDSNGATYTPATNTITIAFPTAPANGAVISGNTSVNAVNGVATFSGLSINKAGFYTFTASSAPLTSATSTGFNAIGAVRLGFTVQPVNTQAKTTMALIKVAVQDLNGITVTSATNAVTIAFSTAPVNGAVISGTTTVNAVSGVATFSGLSIDKGGTYKFTASSPDVTSATSNEFTITGPTKLGFTVQPDDAVANATMDDIKVAVRLGSGSTFTTGTYAVTIAFSVTPVNGAMLSGTTTVNSANGIATFSGLKVDKDGTYKFTVSSPDLTSALSNDFTISGPTKLGFTVQPANALVNATMADIKVAVRWASGTTFTSGSYAVTIALTTPNGAALSGTKTVSSVNGIATFSGLSIDKAGSYTFTASSPGLLSAVSNTLTVTPAGGSTIALGQFVAFAQDFVYIGANTDVNSGDIGANTSLWVRPKGNPRSGRDRDDPDPDRTPEVIIGENVDAMSPNSTIFGDTVWLRSRAEVQNVKSNELINWRGKVNGVITTGVNLPLLALPSLPAMTPGTKDIEVARRGTLTLAAGAYKKLTVNQDATIILTGGVYHFTSLEIDEHARVYARGSVEIRVSNEMDTDSNSVIGPDPSTPSVKAHDIRIYVKGGDDYGRRYDNDEVGPVAVDLGESSTVNASIYAPNGTINLRSHSTGAGAFVAQRLIVGESVDLTRDSAF